MAVLCSGDGRLDIIRSHSMAYQGPVIRSFESRYGHTVPSEFELLEALEAQQKGEELTGWNTVRLAPNKGFSSGSTTRSTFHGDASPPVTENQLLDKNYQHKPHLGQETLVKGEPQFRTANYGIPTASPYGRTERESEKFKNWRDGRMGNDRYSGIREPQGQASRMQAQATTSNSTPQLSSMTPRQRIEYLAPLALKFDEDQKTIVNPKTGETKIASDAVNRYKLLLNQEIDRVAKRYGRSNALRLVKSLESSGYGNLITREIEDTSAVDNEGKPVAGKMKSVSYEEASKLASMNPYELELSKLPKDRARLLKDLSPEFIRAVAAEQDLDDTGALSPIFRYIVRMETGVDPKESDVQRYIVENSDLIPAIKAKAKLLDSVDKRMKAYGKPSLPIRGEEEDRWAGVTKQPEPVQTAPAVSTPEKPMSIPERMAIIRQDASPEMRSYVDMMEKLAIAQERSGNREQAQETLNELQGKVIDLQARWNTEDRWSKFQKDAKAEINRQAYESDGSNINPQTQTILDHDVRQNTEELNRWGNLKFDDYAKKERIMQDIEERLNQGRAMIKQDISSNNIKSALNKLNGLASNLLKVAGDKGPAIDNIRQQIEYAKSLLDTNPVQAGKVIDDIFTQYGQLAGR
jgi:hypothetical protein